MRLWLLDSPTSFCVFHFMMLQMFGGRPVQHPDWSSVKLRSFDGCSMRFSIVQKKEKDVVLIGAFVALKPVYIFQQW